MSDGCPSGRQLTLDSHGQRLTVVEVGGGIRTYDRDGTPVLDGYGEHEMCTGGRGQFLAPWPNRLGDGRFEWRGRILQGPLTEVAAHNAIHGLVRWASWDLSSPSPARAVAEHRLHPQPGWDWTLDFRVTYDLSAAGLEVTTEVTNRSGAATGACPFGFGWHPYLHAFGGVADDSLLTVPARIAYRTDDRGLPVGRYDVAGSDRDFRTGRLVGADRIDTCFTDLVRDEDGRSAVRLAPGATGSATELLLDRAYTHVMVYTGDTLPDPARRRRGVAVEPMTGPPDLLRSGDGRRVIEVGETFVACWALQIV